MTINQGPVGPSTRYSAGYQSTWGPYWDVMFPPAQVTAWISFKRGSTGVNIARRFWAQREYLRRAYESVYGSDPAAWPSRHPGVVLDAVPSVDHPACLGCQWFGGGGGSALLRAREHETSDVGQGSDG
jgi:hypothetical protein